MRGICFCCPRFSVFVFFVRRGSLLMFSDLFLVRGFLFVLVVFIRMRDG